MGRSVSIFAMRFPPTGFRQRAPEPIPSLRTVIHKQETAPSIIQSTRFKGFDLLLPLPQCRA